MSFLNLSGSLFVKIVAVIFIFTIIVWYATERSQTAQYQNTDLIYDYQNLTYIL